VRPNETPERVKRQVFLLLLPLAAVVSAGLGAQGIVTGRLPVWSGAIAVGSGVVLALYAAAFAFAQEAADRVERSLVFLAMGVMAASLLIGAFAMDEGDATLQLVRQGIWLPVVYGIGFLVMPLRVGLVLAWSVWMLLAVAASSHLLHPVGHSASELTTITETVLANAATIVVLAGVARVIRASYERAALLEDAANTDSLTRIANRRSGEQHLEDEVERSIRYGRPLSVVLFDLDLFKRVNDTLGHEAGDRVLVEVPQVLAPRLRESDMLVRWGGEEFLIIAPEMDLERATRMAQRLRSLIEEHDFGIAWPMTASFGVAQRDGIESGADMVRRADEAMYAAKRRGRNAVWRSVVKDGRPMLEHVDSGPPTRTKDHLPYVEESREPPGHAPTESEGRATGGDPPSDDDPPSEVG